MLILTIGTIHAIIISYIEGWSIGAGLWYTTTAGTTVGFGDYSPATGWGRIITVLFIYIPAIPIISYLMSQGIEVFLDKREQKTMGLVRIKMKEHIVIFNFPKMNQRAYLEHFMGEFKKTSDLTFKDISIVIVSTQFPQGLPNFMHPYNVRLVAGSGATEDILQKCSLADARRIVIMEEDIEPHSPFEIAYQIIQSYPQLLPKIIAESNDQNATMRLRSMGVEHLSRSIRSYPELLARSIISPGMEEIIYDLWDSEGEECLLLKQPYNETSWADICHDILSKDMGTPLGVITQDGVVRSDLKGSEVLSVQGVYVIVPEDSLKIFNQYNNQ